MKRISRAAVIAASVALVVSGCSNGNAVGDGYPTTGGDIVVGAAHSISQLNPAVITLAFESTLYPLVWKRAHETGGGRQRRR